MPFPLLPNRRYDQFRADTLTLSAGVHLVEQLRDGRYIGITKPGYKGVQDFSVAIVETDRRTRGHALSHVDMLGDFHCALATDRALGRAFIDQAFLVFGGAEPPENLPPLDTAQHGRRLPFGWVQRPVPATTRRRRW